MSDIFIKYFVVILCSTYSYIKILNLQSIIAVQRRKFFSVVLFVACLMALVILTLFLRFIAPAISLTVMVALSVPLFRRIYRGTIQRSASCTIIAYGVSYAALAVAACMEAILEISIVSFAHNDLMSSWRMVMAALFQIVVTLVIFRMKRLRRGLVFLVDTGSSDIGVYISASILLLASLLGINQDRHLVYSILTCIFLLAGIALWFWWKDRTTTVYLKELHLREIQTLKKELEQKSRQIKRLQTENEKMAVIIHRDNKQLPAVYAYIRDIFQAGNSRASELDAEGILKNIDDIFQDRQTAVRELEKQNCQSMDTGSTPIDLTLNYMSKRAMDADIDFHISLPDDFPRFLKERISEEDLNTLLADLLENAIIATTSSSKRRILLNIDMDHIEIYDSGIPFQLEVFVSFGLHRMTSHPADGGTGIGLESTYKLCQKYHASFVIEEYEQEHYYTKRVAICFDSLTQYRVKVMDKSQTSIDALSVNPKIMLF